ncbi:site-specific DNA-methyltransferase [Vibrio vulnificus]|uniref:DNA methyltransferase n=1 Tax=Vibrio TaxID=662 RepID=UPI00068E8CE9|nr:MULTISPECIES: DNA methyltransferase [Vibrio]EHI9302579.1 site-specific DNA-methyltransferase [Vibrio vulnificus]EHR7291076.1 site-specific DNA-methyltransferase [Vibrio parahaemolyticus]EHK9054741.1 site-specific DNA-methyltransferase [Vibrio vulnificus]ELB2073914.1 site-specific DNA-methyltransferase [Vibrio parahaemolyticus]ELP4435394.1 site-specific DNA-methyltransferase [Vibrio vulnificus]
MTNVKLKVVEADEPQIEDGDTARNEIKPVHPKNKLNDLNGTEWLPETKSFWFQKGLGSKHAHAQIERLHPAPFSFQDVMRLIKFFTKSGDTVLDPFSGVGSTMKACALTNRCGVGIELTESWNALAKKRLLVEVGDEALDAISFINGDCRKEIKNLEDNSIDFLVTSPPYWSILNKKVDHKTKVRIEEELETSYSEDERDLGNISDYNEFLEELKRIFIDAGKKLKNNKYMAIIVSDFRHKSKFYSFHSDIIRILDEQVTNNNKKLTLQGVKVLAQNHKSLLPYGYPYAYVENIHHQYILIFRKDK